MTTLKEQIFEFDRNKAKQLPEDILNTMNRVTVDLKYTKLENNSLKTGDKAPGFNLSDHNGISRPLSEYLNESLVVLTFYRGGWCPYCNLELHALQKSLPQIKAAGAKLVAISPESPDHSLSTREKNDLAFDVLHDKGNHVARSFGLEFILPEELRPIYGNMGIDIPGHNGDTTFKLPMPATYIVNQRGEIIYHFVDADYTKRLEPAKIVAKLTQV
ncbi:MAG: peroxiredoxin-like family protein [Desulfuromusa sp.]|nr:peroxiredoxin-like family protein [Desulfuromusa sp.]